MKRAISALLTIVLTIICFTVAVTADTIPAEGFITKTETAAETFAVDDVFVVKFSIADVAEGFGYAGIDLFINFDPEIFEAVTQKDDNGNDIKAEVVLPAEWTGDNVVLVEFVTDDQGKQIGEITINAANDGSDDKDFSGDDFYATIAFKCLKEISQPTTIEVDAAFCAYLVDDYYTDVPGKTSAITINEIIIPVKDNKMLIIISATVAAVVIIAAVAIVLVKKKK